MLTNRQKTKILVDGGDPKETLRILRPPHSKIELLKTWHLAEKKSG